MSATLFKDSVTDSFKKSKKIDRVIVPGGCTLKYIQAPDLSSNKPFLNPCALKNKMDGWAQSEYTMKQQLGISKHP